MKGRAGIRHFLGQFPKITSFKTPLVEIDGNGDIAYTRGTYEVTMMPGFQNPGEGQREVHRDPAETAGWLLAY